MKVSTSVAKGWLAARLQKGAPTSASQFARRWQLQADGRGRYRIFCQESRHDVLCSLSLLNGGSIGDAFKAGLIGGLVGGISAGIAGKIGDAFGGYGEYGTAGELGRGLAHGVSQGALTEVQGGEFRHGFYAGFAASAAAGPIQLAMPDNVAGRTVAAAVVGGTASAIGGGKFANGAVSGAFTHLFNHEDHLFRSVYQKPVAILLIERSMLKGDAAGDYIVKAVKEMNNRLRRSGVTDAKVRIEAYDRLSDIEVILASVASPNETVYVGAVAHGQFATKDPSSFLGTVKLGKGSASSEAYRQTVNDAVSKFAPNAGSFADHCSAQGFQPVTNILNDMSLYLQKRYPDAIIYPGSY